MTITESQPIEDEIIRIEAAKYRDAPLDDYEQEARISLFLYRRANPDAELSGALMRTIVRRRLASLHKGDPPTGNMHKGHRYLPPTDYTDDDGDLSVLGTNHPAADYEALQRVLADDVAKAVSALPGSERYAAVAVMYALQAHEVSAAAGVSRSAIPHAWKRAAGKLYDQLYDYA